MSSIHMAMVWSCSWWVRPPLGRESQLRGPRLRTARSPADTAESGTQSHCSSSLSLSDHNDAHIQTHNEKLPGHVDIGHVNIRSCEYKVKWISGHVNIRSCKYQSCEYQVMWILGHVNFRSSEYQVMWISGHVNIRSCRFQVMWTSGHVNIRSCEYQVMYIAIHLSITSCKTRSCKHLVLQTLEVFTSGHVDVRSGEYQVNIRLFELQVIWTSWLTLPSTDMSASSAPSRQSGQPSDRQPFYSQSPSWSFW